MFLFKKNDNIGKYVVVFYWAQNEAYMCRSAENVVRRLCFNKLCTVG